MVKIIVIDASTSLSWVLKEKEVEPKITQILGDITSDKISALAPTLWLYETINGLRSAILAKRIKGAKVNKYYQKILELCPDLLDFSAFAFETFQIALKFQLSIYDASYIALAKEQNCELFTADKKLYGKVKDKLKFVKLVSHYSTPNSDSNGE